MALPGTDSACTYTGLHKLHSSDLLKKVDMYPVDVTFCHGSVKSCRVSVLATDLHAQPTRKTAGRACLYEKMIIFVVLGKNIL